MAKFIDSEAAYRFAQDQLKKETGAYSKGWNNAMNVMKSAFHNNDAISAADVVPVKHGRWEWNEENWWHRCSACGMTFDYSKTYELFDHGFQLASYCPNCGARMDGDA